MRGRCIALGLLALAACSSEKKGTDATPASAARASAGPDPIVLRVARSGGPVRAYRYPQLDSVLWTSSEPAAAPEAALAFDQENGLLAFVDQRGFPAWVDLRLGRVTRASDTRLAHLASISAWSIFGVTTDTSVWRLTPSGEWNFVPGGKVARLFPQPDGDLVVLTADNDRWRLLRYRPPVTTVLDSAAIDEPLHWVASPLGDRLYFARGREVIARDANAFGEIQRLRFPAEIVALAITPSGDRLFAAMAGRSHIDVYDRYEEDRIASVTLPGPVRELRMDPLGRLLLARPDSGDSAWVISVGTNEHVATLQTAWRADLPAVAFDGTVAAAIGRDVQFIMPGESRARMIVRQGAGEFWHFAIWNGFRPRAKELDQPVVFAEDSSAFLFGGAATDSSVAPSVPRADSIALPPSPPRDSVRPSAPAREVWTVSFAAVLSEDRARAMAQEIRVDGQPARVVVSETDGVRVFRVVLGPYGTRAEAERVGRASRRSYWVFEGVP